MRKTASYHRRQGEQLMTELLEKEAAPNLRALHSPKAGGTMGLLGVKRIRGTGVAKSRNVGSPDLARALHGPIEGGTMYPSIFKKIKG